MRQGGQGKGVDREGQPDPARRVEDSFVHFHVGVLEGTLSLVEH